MRRSPQFQCINYLKSEHMKTEKAITIKQPWACLIVEGIKDIENRSWATKEYDTGVESNIVTPFFCKNKENDRFFIINERNESCLIYFSFKGIEITPLASPEVHLGICRR